jgi:Domain of unknown function (DUF4345)
MGWIETIAIIACGLGAGMGGYAMISPSWASGIVRLVPNPAHVEGKSEFRATYGGLFLASHLLVAWAIWERPDGWPLAASVLGFGWMGAGVGRVISLFADRAVTGLNLFNVGFEAVMGLALLAPLLTGRALA